MLPRARWVDTANLHLTLLFFGQVEDAKMPALAAALGEKDCLEGRFTAGEVALVAQDIFEAAGTQTTWLMLLTLVTTSSTCAMRSRSLKKGIRHVTSIHSSFD